MTDKNRQKGNESVGEKSDGLAGDALKPCPFCGAHEDELGICTDPDLDGASRRIQCYSCNVEAPFYPSESDAIDAWNQRAHAAPSSPPLNEQCKSCFFKGRTKCMCSEEFADPEISLPAPEALGAAWVSEADILALLPGCYYMDPPDGGGVTPLEQLQRMAKDAARYRFIRSTTKAVRADDGEGRVEVTPEKFDAMTDISIEVHKDAEAQDAFYRAIRAAKDQS